MGGAVLQWLRDEMRFFASAPDADYFGGKVKDTEGVYFVPAFTGLGAPHWDMYARGSIFGLTRGTTPESYHPRCAGRYRLPVQGCD